MPAIIKIFCTLLLLTGLNQFSAQASESAQPPQPNTSTAASTNQPAFKTLVRVEDGPGLMAVTRAYLTVGTNKLGMQVPVGFRTETASRDSVALISHEVGCLITVRLLTELTLAQPLTHDLLRDTVMKENGQAKIIGELELSSLGQWGPAFDLAYIDRGSERRSRVTYIPTTAGVIEFTVSCVPAKFALARQALHVLLLSIRQSDPNGELQMPAIRNSV
jgi:hypothetical protein